MLRTHFHRAPLGVLVALQWVGGVAHAASDVNAPEDLLLAEVVVTARGREENLQDVSDSVAAFTRSDIEVRRLTSVQDFAAITPGVLMVRDQDAGTNIITVRGVSANRNQAASIAFVVDGVALADSEFFTADLFGLERVEILKGPQGALYGKNAIGGVVNVVTRQPSTDLGGRVQVGVGNGEQYSIDGLVTGALGTDRVRGLLAGSLRDTDGFIDNSTLGQPVDFMRSTNVRARVMADLTDALTLDLRANYMDESGGAAWAAPFPATQLTGGKLDPDLLGNPINDYRGVTDREWRGISATLTYETSAGTFSATSGYDDYSKYWEGDLDASPLPIVQPVSQPIDLEVFTQEVRFTSSAEDRLQWIAGAFDQNTRRERLDYLSRALPVPDVLYTSEADQIAGFLQASYQLTDRLNVLGALRYDEDRRDEVASIPAAGMVTRSLGASFDKWQPKVSLSYDVTPRHMIYATYAAGFKTGGFNPAPAPGDSFGPIYGPETTKSYEVGAKTAWLDQRLIANFAVFVLDYQDKQEFVLTPTLSQATINVPQVDVEGFELQLGARITDHLKLDAAYGRTIAEMKDFHTSNFLGPRDYSGNRTTYTPPFNLNVGAEYRRGLGSSNMNATLRIDYSRVGRTFWEVDNILFTPEYGWGDVRLALEGGSWSLALWGKNVSDERWATSAYGQGQVALLNLLGYDAYFINPGRQYGMSFEFRFGAER
jgi:iron complex outermembrane receptor protein